MTAKYKNIVILTGAGISAESGLSTFRDEEGLWNNHRVEDVATIEAFYRQPDFVHKFYNDMKQDLFNTAPNKSHLAITELQNNFKGEVAIITQNIDTLHEKAGNKNVYHIHGSINEAVCLNCDNIITTWEAVTTKTPCPTCSSYDLKPNIVFFGEQLLCMDKVDSLLNNCDLFLSIGTSGKVFPANSFVKLAKYNGATTIEFNLNTTDNSYDFDKSITGKAGVTLPLFVKELLRD